MAENDHGDNAGPAKALTDRMGRPIRRKHGMCGTKIYCVWAGLIARCTNQKHSGWDDYGGRGITVCDKWLKFQVVS